MPQYIKTTGLYFYKTYKNGKSVRVSKDEYDRNNKIIGGGIGKLLWGGEKNNKKSQNNKNFFSSPLIYAIIFGTPESLINLLEQGYDPNIKSKDNITALMVASVNNKKDCVKILLKKSADPNIQSNNGTTALMFASINGNIDIVKLLLDKNANINLHTSNGSTALMLAVEHNNEDIVKLLLDKNARFNNSIFNNANSNVIRNLLSRKKNKLFNQTKLGESSLYIHKYTPTQSLTNNRKFKITGETMI
jgi:ankyrin repeat protein